MSRLSGRAFAAALATACAAGLVVALIATLGTNSTGQPGPVPTFRTVPLPSLAVLARRRGIAIGVGANWHRIAGRPSYRALVTDNFTSYTEQNMLKWQFVEPAEGQFDFTAGDAAVAFAHAHNLRFRGTALVWNYQLPHWLTDRAWTRPELLQVLHQHITAEVRHFRGRIAQWDVVNEPIRPNGHGLLPSIWEQVIGPHYIALAFRWAHEADPSAKLFLNDYGNEGVGQPHFRADYELLRLLKQQGVPVDGLGMQMHRNNPSTPSNPAIRAAMRTYGDLGLAVEVTELDYAMPLPPSATALVEQASTFRGVVADCVEVAACTGVTVWGGDDGDLPPEYIAHGVGSATLFDVDDRRKIDYNGLAQGLAFAPGRPGALPFSLLRRRPSPTLSPG